MLTKIIIFAGGTVTGILLALFLLRHELIEVFDYDNGMPDIEDIGDGDKPL